MVHSWMFVFDMVLGINGDENNVVYFSCSIRVPGVIIHSYNYLFVRCLVFNSQIITQNLRIAKKVKYSFEGIKKPSLDGLCLLKFSGDF
jgi:hypothetical protein